MAKAVIITGAHNSGKTTFIEKVVRTLTSRGYSIAYIKHDPKGKAITDTEGKDSWKVYTAGAQQVVVASPQKLSIFVRQSSYDLEYVVRILESFNPDLIVVEGFRTDTRYDKFEVIRKQENRQLMCDGDPNLKGVITDYYDFHLKFDINKPETFAEFLEKNYIRG